PRAEHRLPCVLRVVEDEAHELGLRVRRLRRAGRRRLRGLAAATAAEEAAADREEQHDADDDPAEARATEQRQQRERAAEAAHSPRWGAIATAIDDVRAPMSSVPTHVPARCDAHATNGRAMSPARR